MSTTVDDAPLTTRSALDTIWVYRPELDGLRTLAVFLVLLFHSAVGAFGGGFIGVDVFFVLSGFLVSSILLDEAWSRGTIDLPRFLARRVRRLLPAAVVVVLATSVISVLTSTVIRRLPWVGDAQSALLYVSNWRFLSESRDYFGADIDKSPFQHFWSLSVEEQFYLLWPALLCLAGIAGSMWSAAAAIAIAPVVRVLMFWAFPEHERLIHQAFPTTMDSIAVGCLYAGARHYFRSAEEGPLVVRSGVIALGLVVGAFICNSLSVHPWFKYAMGASLMNLAIAGVIDFVVNTNGRCDRVLNWPPIVYIGTLSYSLYLWQQLFMNRQSDFLVCSFPLNVLASLGVSAFSYQVLEQPLLRLRSRFRHQASQGAQKAMPSGITPAISGHVIPVEIPGPR